MENNINDLVKLIEIKESTKLINWSRSKKEKVYDFAPVNSKGDPETNIDARPTIIFEIDNDNNKFILRWIYLRYPRQGLGRQIFNWIINFCRNNSFKNFEIKSVGKDKIAMRRLCSDFGFIKTNSSNNNDDFKLEIK